MRSGDEGQRETAPENDAFRLNRLCNPRPTVLSLHAKTDSSAPGAVFRPCSAVLGVSWGTKKGVWKTYLQMPLMLQENFTAKLLEMLRAGELHCAITAEPFPDTGLAVAPLYDAALRATRPSRHCATASTLAPCRKWRGCRGAPGYRRD